MIDNIRQKIAVSTGHSRKDPGTIACDGTPEYKLNVELRDELFQFCIPGYELWASDHDCEDLGYPEHLIKTVKNINQMSPLPICCLEFHHNWTENSNVRGAELIYWDYSDLGYLLAKSIKKQFDEYFPKATIKPNLKYFDHAKYFLRKTKVPSLIIEPAFISNYEDLVFAQSQRLEIANSIYKGIREWLKKI